MSAAPSYGAITPVRDDADNLRRLAACLAKQTSPPSVWLLVDTGSTDDSGDVAAALARAHDWVRTMSVGGDAAPTRGATIVRAFHAGLATLESPPDVIVKLDADVSMEPDYFERLLNRFAEEPELGMASGSAYELQEGDWKQRHVTGTSVWGAARAYRRECLEDVLPLDERMGWDGLDEFRANVSGWTTRAFPELSFRHHRGEGERDGRIAPWIARGRASRYLGYRGWYLALRAVFHARHEPAALAMLWGFGAAALRREPQCTDADVRAYLRRQQSLRALPARARESLGRRLA